MERRRAARRAWKERNRDAVNAARREARVIHEDGLNAKERRAARRKSAAVARRDMIAEEMQHASAWHEVVFPHIEPSDPILSLQRDLQLAKKMELQQAMMRRARGVRQQDKPLDYAMVPPAKDTAYMQGVRYE